MSLIQIGTNSDTVHCIDDVDLTLTFDSESLNEDFEPGAASEYSSLGYTSCLMCILP